MVLSSATTKCEYYKYESFINLFCDLESTRFLEGPYADVFRCFVSGNFVVKDHANGKFSADTPSGR